MMKVRRTPPSSRAAIPAMVVPPGEETCPWLGGRSPSPGALAGRARRARFPRGASSPSSAAVGEGLAHDGHIGGPRPGATFTAGRVLAMSTTRPHAPKSSCAVSSRRLSPRCARSRDAFPHQRRRIGQTRMRPEGEWRVGSRGQPAPRVKSCAVGDQSPRPAPRPYCGSPQPDPSASRTSGIPNTPRMRPPRAWPGSAAGHPRQMSSLGPSTAVLPRIKASPMFPEPRNPTRLPLMLTPASPVRQISRSPPAPWSRLPR